MAEGANGGAGKSAFEERFDIDFSSPLSDFDTGGGSAYAVTDKKDEGEALYALIQHPTVPVRNSVYNGLAGKPIRGLVNPVARGIADVKDGGKTVQRLVTIFQRPTGGKVIGDNGTHASVNVGRLRTTILASLIHTIAQLHKRGFLHRGILPSRLFLLGETSDEIVIGECVSEPAGYNRHMMQEPLEVAMADQYGRGTSEAPADIFHIGVALLSAFLGRDVTDASGEEMALLTSRVNQGSFAALASSQSVPGALGKAIQGMMIDEPDERWTLTEVVDWMDGSTAHRRSGLVNRSLTRPTAFAGISYADRRLLAEAFVSRPEDAVRFMRDKEFLNWLRMSLRDEVLNDKIEGLLGVGPAAEGGSGSTWDHTLLARLAMILHPDGPIRFGGIKLMPDGFAGAIAYAYAADNRAMLKTLREMSRPSFLASLAEIVGDRNPGLSKGLKIVSKAHDAMGNTDLGYGPENALYRLNPQMPCVSTRFGDYWVGSLKLLLFNLDRIAKKDGLSNVLMDRHIAAFCIVHGTDLARDFRKLATFQKDPAKFNLHMTQFLGMLQTRLKIRSLPNVTSALVDALKPNVKALKNKKRRERVTEALDKIRENGQISRMVSEVDLAKIQQEDAREWAQARRQMTQIERARARLSGPISANDPEALANGLKGGAGVSGLVALGSIIMAFF